jgi:hypothetical protein
MVCAGINYLAGRSLRQPRGWRAWLVHAARKTLDGRGRITKEEIDAAKTQPAIPDQLSTLMPVSLMTLP